MNKKDKGPDDGGRRYVMRCYAACGNEWIVVVVMFRSVCACDSPLELTRAHAHSHTPTHRHAHTHTNVRLVRHRSGFVQRTGLVGRLPFVMFFTPHGLLRTTTPLN